MKSAKVINIPIIRINCSNVKYIVITQYKVQKRLRIGAVFQTVEKVLSAVILSVVETRRARVRGSRGGKSVNFRRFSGGASPSPTNLCEFYFPT